MKSAIYMGGNRFVENTFDLEEDFENEVKNNSQILFGPKTIYLDIKNKIATKTLGNSIPDGFLFDFRNEDDPQFYLVEVELEKHDFDGHIFPQIKKFFTFFKNPKGRDELIEKMFGYIKQNPQLEQKFKEFLGNKELYKTIKDVIENNQNILLIVDENKPQFEETSDTITEWAKFVRVEVLKKYTANDKDIFILDPDFEEIDPLKHSDSDEAESGIYDEHYHLEGVEQIITSAYNKIKEMALATDPGLRIYATKSYITFSKQGQKNFIWIKPRRKRILISVRLPYKLITDIVKNHKVFSEGDGLKTSYVMVDNDNHLNEIIDVIKEGAKFNKNIKN